MSLYQWQSIIFFTVIGNGKISLFSLRKFLLSVPPHAFSKEITEARACWEILGLGTGPVSSGDQLGMPQPSDHRNIIAPGRERVGLCVVLV